MISWRILFSHHTQSCLFKVKFHWWTYAMSFYSVSKSIRNVLFDFEIDLWLNVDKCNIYGDLMSNKTKL
jgi:hypothetical protein